MKFIKIALLLISIPCLIQAQNVSVEGNKKVNTDFSKYKTYGWSRLDATVLADEYEIYTYTEEVPVKSKVGNKNGTPRKYVYSYNVIIPATNPVINTSVQNSIAEELEGRGYKASSTPDLLVVYRVLDKKARFKGYKNDNPTMVGANEVRQPSDTTTFLLEPGTLLVSLIDVKTSQVVWDGFASGLYQQNAFVSDEMKLKEAVHLIFARFNYRADNIKAEK